MEENNTQVRLIADSIRQQFLRPDNYTIVTGPYENSVWLMRSASAPTPVLNVLSESQLLLYTENSRSTRVRASIKRGLEALGYVLLHKKPARIGGGMLYLFRSS